MKIKFDYRIVAWSLIALAVVSCSRSKPRLSDTILLSNNWLIQHSARVNLPGSIVSGNILDTTGWYRATVPSTVMGTLTRNGLYKDIFMADSMKNVSQEPFSKSWWYRTTFKLPALKSNQHVMLKFDGISYYANIWLNSKLVASRDSVYGTFRTFSFDITSLLKESGNTLAVEVFRQEPGDFGLGFVDWNPAPPDNNMGIWREVSLNITGDVSLEHTWVRTDDITSDLDEASLSVITELVNHSSGTVTGDLIGNSDAFSFRIPVKLKAGEHRKMVLSPAEIKSLKISNPKLWWCNNMGDPNLYSLNLQFAEKNAVSDMKDILFGIRTIQTYFNSAGHKGFRLNGKDILIRGAGWTDDIFLRDTPERNEIQVQYVKDMNLNTIRFESVWGNSQNIYSLCDKYGLLVMVGWSCQWEWDEYLGKACDDYGGIKTDKDMDLMVKSLGNQIQYLQNHPSIFVWMVGSDKIPRPALEKRYRDLIGKMDNRPYLASASKRLSTVSGPTGVKMNGPYDYVGPSYWYTDTINGGAFGFNTETGPGPQVPVRESLLKMIPADKLWPINDVWNYHCNPSKTAFNNLNYFNSVLQQRYGSASNLDNYLLKSDVQGYEAMRAMYESFRANRPETTGIIQWMLNSAWPSFYWQLYDYYLLPTSAYYAAKKANAPLQLVYNYANHHLYLVNETMDKFEKLKARIRCVDLNGKELFSEERMLAIEENSTSDIFNVRPVAGISYLALELLNEKNELLADNFYWLSPKADEYAWDKTEWYYTPMKVSADFREFNSMAPAVVEMKYSHQVVNNQPVVEVKLTNTSDKPAFFIHLTLKDRDDKTIFPVFWDDNYISLLPGDSRAYHCRLPATSADQDGLGLYMSGWNVKEQLTRVDLK
jgi:exo-1,4-beta-D-glucosaminidase